MKILLVLISLSSAIWAADPINTNFRGVAVKGYDVVAYFQQSKPVKGNKSFTFKWKNATWYFSSAANLEAFKSDPERYAPQFGGYCAWAVSQGYTANIDPEAWRIVDGKLYLNYDRKIQAKWELDITGNIEKAQTNWPKILAE